MCGPEILGCFSKKYPRTVHRLLTFLTVLVIPSEDSFPKFLCFTGSELGWLTVDAQNIVDIKCGYQADSQQV
ncbi:hypothetical protein E5288_WYG013172 [Bos mutus]|uniref:Uncharacterized protein n=1 Tax=Bos mutus TaxID=72004 RepID=A0A6B0RZ85_9CETA|nr:hypothetical protein [Bos mutus]